MSQGGTVGPWGAVIKSLFDTPAEIRKAKKSALLREGEFFRGEIIKGLRDQAPGGKHFKPLSERTIAIRRLLGFKGTKALMRHGDLRNSISVHSAHDANDYVFVGVLRTAKNSKGEAMVDVARLNEEGSKPIIIKMTPKMAALLHAAFDKAGLHRMGPPRPSTGVVVVQIPPRPFMGPVFEQHGGEEASKRFAEQVKKNMQGKGVWAHVRGRL